MRNGLRSKLYMSCLIITINVLHGADVREKIVHEKRIDTTPFLFFDHDFSYVWCKMRQNAIISFCENDTFREKKIPVTWSVKENDIVQIPLMMNFTLTINGIEIFRSEPEYPKKPSDGGVLYIRTCDTRMSDPVNGYLLEESWYRYYPSNRLLATSASMPRINDKEITSKR